jgi:hypothetical protein
MQLQQNSRQCILGIKLHKTPTGLAIHNRPGDCICATGVWTGPVSFYHPPGQQKQISLSLGDNR